MIKYLIEEAGILKTFRDNEWISLPEQTKEEQTFIEEGFDDYESIEEDKWQELGSFDLLRWVQGEISYEEVSQTLSINRDYELDGGFLISSTVDPETINGRIESLSVISPYGPGSFDFIGGDMTQGFFGEIEASDFITGDALSSEIGITQGTVQYLNEPWLKFALDDKILFVPKKPFRHSISWDHINQRNAVYGDENAPIVEIDQYRFKVRLLKGAHTDPAPWGDSDRGAIGSEWNRLMYPIHEHAGTGNWANSQYVGDNVPDWGVGYTDADLLTHQDHGYGAYSWTQETQDTDTSRRVGRGRIGVSALTNLSSPTASSPSGWRPVLELL